MNPLPAIQAVEVYLPETTITTDEVTSRITYPHPHIRETLASKMDGDHTRHFAGPDLQVSDLACRAATRVLRQFPHTRIDLLIFAAASSDLIEPATANIIQANLGLDCPVMDIKNACNSVVSAIHAASAYIAAGYYRHVLIVNGEKLEQVINFQPRDVDQFVRCRAGYSLGDAGAAILLGPNGGSPIIYQHMASWGQHWELCTVAGGGSRAYHQSDKYFFECDSGTLRQVFKEKFPGFVRHCLKESPWGLDEIDCVITHQITAHTSGEVAAGLNIPPERCICTFPLFGNTAAATIPLALDHAVHTGRLNRGDKLLVLGLAAGISMSFQLIEW